MFCTQCLHVVSYRINVVEDAGFEASMSTFSQRTSVPVQILVSSDTRCCCGSGIITYEFTVHFQSIL